MTLTYRKKELHLRNHLFWDVDVSKVRPGANKKMIIERVITRGTCLLYTSPSPRDRTRSRMPSSA